MKKHRFTIIVVSLITASIILIAVLQATKTTETRTQPIDNQELIYLGNGDSENEILLLFDYACHWCVVWMEEIYPTIGADYINTGKVKFRTQAMTYVNDASQRLGNFDQNVKDHAPEHYDEIFYQIMADTHPESEVPNWGTDDYIQDLINTYQLNEEQMLTPPELDATELSYRYTQALNIESVPTVYVNDSKVEDAFDLEEIEDLLN